MTSEEILDFAKRATAELKEPREIDHLDHEAVAVIIREAVAKAYEEAAQALQAQCNAKGTGCLAHCTHPESVEAVRALASSLRGKEETRA